MATWATNQDMNSNYFPGEGGLSAIYADTNEILCTGIQVVAGFKFWQKGNRLAAAIYASNPDGSRGQWIQYNDANNQYFPGKGGLSAIYADTNPLYVPNGKIMIGFALRQKGNRLAPRILVTNPDGSERNWIQNDDMNNQYFPGEGGLSAIYADTNELVFSPGNQVKGLMFWEKGNRLAPALLA
jgi:hypothetical protein